MTSASAAADNVRQLCWVEDRFPVDPVAIARKLGVRVVETALPGNVSGALFKEVGQDPVIVIHESDSDNRKRFSCAHELGHFIARSESDKAEDQYEYLDLRSDRSSSGDDPDEIWANRFAAELLMPQKNVKVLASRGVPHFEMALRFGVSNAAMKFRLTNLSLVPPNNDEPIAC